MTHFTRRGFLFSASLAGTSAVASARTTRPSSVHTAPPPSMKIGIVTYNIAKDWDLPTIIKNLSLIHISEPTRPY